MYIFRLLSLASFALTTFLLPIQEIRAAETQHTCTGFIDAVPVVISSQGVWCLRQNLGTSIASGSAITIAANNVTIDCNDFKLGGLGAGKGSDAIGISAGNRQNANIRRCSIRGFRYGIRLEGGAGHLVEDNRLDSNLSIGIQVSGDNNLVRRNHVHNTGGRTGSNWAYGIQAQAHVIDNSVVRLYADQADGLLLGMAVSADGARISGNSVSGFDAIPVQGGSIGGADGISAYGQHMRVSHNHVTGWKQAQGTSSGTGLVTWGSSFCLDNTVGGFTVNIAQCTVSARNLTWP